MIPSASLMVLSAHALAGLTTLAFILRRDRVVAPAILPCLLGLAAGPLGIVIALVLTKVNRRFPGNAPARDWTELLCGRAEVRDRRLVDRVCDNRVRHPSPGELSSFYDILRFGNVTMRQRVVATVVRSFEPALAPVIARALTDPDQSVRAQAAAAATDFQNNFTSRRRALEARAASSGDPAAKTELAMLLGQNAEIVLFSDTVRATLLNESIAALTELRDCNALSPAADRRLAELLLMSGRPEQARTLLETPGAATDDATLLCRLDALFRSGEFDALREACVRLRVSGPVSGDRLTPIVEFWGTGSVAA